MGWISPSDNLKVIITNLNTITEKSILIPVNKSVKYVNRCVIPSYTGKLPDITPMLLLNSLDWVYQKVFSADHSRLISLKSYKNCVIFGSTYKSWIISLSGFRTWRPIMDCPSRSCSSLKFRTFWSATLTPIDGPANPFFFAIPPTLKIVIWTWARFWPSYKSTV